MNIMLLGAPGTGKGTLAEKLVKNHHFIQFSTGDIFRKNIADQTELGLQAQKYMDQGQLVPDKITNEMVALALEKQCDNLIFDGYPRTLDQAFALEVNLTKHNATISRIFCLELSDENIITRITGRQVCLVCKRSYNIPNRVPKIPGVCDFDGASVVRRADDELAKIKVRLAVYAEETAPLIEFYCQKGLVQFIDANNLSAADVYKTLEKELFPQNGNN